MTTTVGDNATLKVVEVARQLRVDPRTIYRVIAAGALRAVKVGRVWRIPADALDDYLRGVR